MKKKEWWIWQARKVDEPWVLHLTAYKEYRKVRADCELFADWLNTPSRLFRMVDVPIVKPEALLRDIDKVCSVYDHPMNDDDRAQIAQELDLLKESFK